MSDRQAVKVTRTSATVEDTLGTFTHPGVCTPANWSIALRKKAEVIRCHTGRKPARSHPIAGSSRWRWLIAAAVLVAVAVVVALLVVYPGGGGPRWRLLATRISPVTGGRSFTRQIVASSNCEPDFRR